MNQKLRMMTIAGLFALMQTMTVQAQITGNDNYDDFYCMTCHGAYGQGSIGIQAPRLAGMESWYLKRQLENFRAGIRGLDPRDREGTEMQPAAQWLTDASIDELVNWVGNWEYRPAETTIMADSEAGRILYSSCASCHGSAGEGNESLGAPALAGQNDWYLVTQLSNFKTGIRGTHPDDGYGAQMAGMTMILPDAAAIENVVSYINTLGK